MLIFHLLFGGGSGLILKISFYPSRTGSRRQARSCGRGLADGLSQTSSCQRALANKLSRTGSCRWALADGRALAHKFSRTGSCQRDLAFTDGLSRTGSCGRTLAIGLSHKLRLFEAYKKTNTWFLCERANGSFIDKNDLYGEFMFHCKSMFSSLLAKKKAADEHEEVPDLTGEESKTLEALEKRFLFLLGFESIYCWAFELFCYCGGRVRLILQILA